jgi:hypothetical protein
MSRSWTVPAAGSGRYVKSAAAKPTSAINDGTPIARPTARKVAPMILRWLPNSLVPPIRFCDASTRPLHARIHIAYWAAGANPAHRFQVLLGFAAWHVRPQVAAFAVARQPGSKFAASPSHHTRIRSSSSSSLSLAVVSEPSSRSAARSRLSACRRRMRSSMLSCMIRRYTVTGRSWPMRCARSEA